MPTLNNPLCATAYGNTGFGDCFLEPDKIVGAIQVPANFSIAPGDLSTLQEFLITKVHAAIGTRVFPYHNWINVADNTEDVTINTTDYGAKIFIKDGFYDFTFRYQKGGVQLHQELAKNEGSGKYFLLYDGNGVAYGYKVGTLLKGIPTELFKVLPWRPNTGAEAAQYLLRMIINPIYLNKGNLGFIKVKDALDFNLFDVAGLQDVELELVSLAGNIATVKAYSKISKVDMYDAFSTNMMETTAWTARNEDSTDAPITTVTLNATLKAWVITFSGGVFYASDKVYLKGSVASVWRAAPIEIEGFEAKDELTIEAPLS